ncbi:MAG TPA: biotin/lipoyl-containing protein, partial [Acidimicrobiales bacterium]
RSPMPGTVIIVAAATGEPVERGDLIAVVEAMKMEYPIVAPYAGVVASIDVAAGDQVTRDQQLAVVEPTG